MGTQSSKFHNKRREAIKVSTCPSHVHTCEAVVVRAKYTAVLKLTMFSEPNFEVKREEPFVGSETGPTLPQLEDTL